MARGVKWSATAAATTGGLAGMCGAPETRLTARTPGRGVPGKQVRRKSKWGPGASLWGDGASRETESSGAGFGGSWR